MSDVLSLCPRRLANTTTVNKRHVLIEVLRDKESAGVSWTWTHLTNQTCYTCGDFWITRKICSKRGRELQHLFPCRYVYTCSDSMALFSWSRGLSHHNAGYSVDFGEWNLIQFRDILNKRSQLKSVPVRDWCDSISTPLFNQTLLQSHAVWYIGIDVRVVSSVWTQESLKW